jgi:hypothetical protein
VVVFPGRNIERMHNKLHTTEAGLVQGVNAGGRLVLQRAKKCDEGLNICIV